MAPSTFTNRLVVTGFCLLVGWLFSQRIFPNLLHSFDARYQSANPQLHYGELGRYHQKRRSGERLDARYFSGVTYYQAVAMNKPILFFTNTPSCSVSQHVAALVGQVAPSYQDRLTLVTLTPPGMSFNVPTGDPINDLMVSCTTPICVVNPQTRFFLAYNATATSQATDLQFALNDFLVRNAQVSR